MEVSHTNATPGSVHPDRLGALDGLRAVSILLVVLSHGWMDKFIPGGLGVTIFFFISGFIITRLMIQEYQQANSVSIRGFYLRRFFRLMPSLSVFIMISLAFMQVEALPWRGQEVSAVLFYLANYYDLFVGFLSSGQHHPLSITWSLAIEEHFYLLFPTVFILLIANTRRFLGVMLVVLVVVLAWRLYLMHAYGLSGLVEYRIYKGTDTRLDSIVYGCVLSLLLFAAPQWQVRLTNRICLWTGVLMLLLSLVLRSEVFRETWRYSLQGMGLFLMMPSLLFVQNWLNKLLSLSWMRHLGRISYSLYLYHWLVLIAVNLLLPDQPLLLRLAVFYGASWLLAECSYRWVEQPGIRFGRKLAH